MNQDNIRSAVREDYARVAREGTSCCGPSCCGGNEAGTGTDVADGAGSTARDDGLRLGYSEEQLDQAPEQANLGLGCGNPLLTAEFKTGETVLDLGSGPGLDSFLAARAVGKNGRVIGVDMTPEMIARARQNAGSDQRAAREDDAPVEFRLGEIEHLPVADESVDIIISNCVINLSPEKVKVFQEAFRVLKPGGRLSIADIVLTGHMPESVKNDPAMLSGCISGAESPDVLNGYLEAAGFEDISLTPTDSSADLIRDWFPGKELDSYVTSAVLRATRPG